MNDVPVSRMNVVCPQCGATNIFVSEDIPIGKAVHCHVCKKKLGVWGGPDEPMLTQSAEER